MIDGGTQFACNICNEGEDHEHSIKWHVYYNHEDPTLDILNSDEHADTSTKKNILKQLICFY